MTWHFNFLPVGSGDPTGTEVVLALIISLSISFNKSDNSPEVNLKFYICQCKLKISGFVCLPGPLTWQELVPSGRGTRQAQNNNYYPEST